MKKILICAIALCLCACDSAEKKKPAKETPIEQTTVNEETKEVPKNKDKYVYIDRVNVLHIKKNCVEFLPLMYEKVSTERTICLHGIIYILKNKLTHSDFYDYCSQCTEVEDYEEIEDVIRVNKNRRTAYDTLDRYYKMPSFEEFDRMLNNEEGRRKAYNALKEKGCKDFCDSYAEFIELIGRELEDDYWEQCRIVYISPVNTDVYHYDEDCAHIKADNGKIDELTIEDAEKQDLKPCKFCIDKK